MTDDLWPRRVFHLCATFASIAAWGAAVGLFVFCVAAIYIISQEHREASR